MKVLISLAIMYIVHQFYQFVHRGENNLHVPGTKSNFAAQFNGCITLNDCTPIRSRAYRGRSLSFKSGNNWVTSNAQVSEVSGFDPEIVRDNFNYKASYYMFGTKYF